MYDINKIQFDIVRTLNEKPDLLIAELAGELFNDENNINAQLNELVENGYIENGDLTSKAYELLESHKIDNAIILAAGMSTRFTHFNFETPKGLLMIKGEILIERQIKQLREKGIQEIVIVVGHMMEKFEYLKEKFGVVLVEKFYYA